MASYSAFKSVGVAGGERGGRMEANVDLSGGVGRSRTGVESERPRAEGGRGLIG